MENNSKYGTLSTLEEIRNRAKYIRENYGRKTILQGRGNYIEPPDRENLPKKEAKKIARQAKDDFFRDLNQNKHSTKDENVTDRRLAYRNQSYNLHLELSKGRKKSELTLCRSKITSEIAELIKKSVKRAIAEGKTRPVVLTDASKKYWLDFYNYLVDLSKIQPPKSTGVTNKTIKWIKKQAKKGQIHAAIEANEQYKMCYARWCAYYADRAKIIPPSGNNMLKSEVNEIEALATDCFKSDQKNKTTKKNREVLDFGRNPVFYKYWQEYYNHRKKLPAYYEGKREKSRPKNKKKNASIRDFYKQRFEDFVAGRKEVKMNVEEIKYLAKRYFQGEKNEQIQVFSALFDANIETRLEFAGYFREENKEILRKIDMWAFARENYDFLSVLRNADVILPIMSEKEEFFTGKVS